MADIKITVNAPEIVEEPKPQATIELKARRTLDGNILIIDHEEIDVVLYPENKKSLVLAKNEYHHNVYEAQERFFKFLWKSGIVDLSLIHI